MATQPRDYYEVLGVSRTATPEELKRQYRNLARKFHPDVNRADDASDRFKEIQSAYEVLSDQARRDRYDRYGHDAPGPEASYGADGAFSDLFDQFFGQGGGRRRGGPARGDDLQVDLELTLEEVAAGAEKTVKYRRRETCEPCSGSGAQPGSSVEACTQCNGSGQVRFAQSTILGTFQSTQTCTRCKGTGKTISNPCDSCHGSGRSTRIVERPVGVPAGADNGMRLRVNGAGDLGERGGPPGDLYLNLFVKDHEIFERRGRDLWCEVWISFATAALGDTIQVPIVGGVETFKVVDGTQSGHVAVLKNKGIPDVNSRGRGDLHIVFQIKVPTKLNAEQKELLRKFAESVGDRPPESPPSRSLFSRFLGQQD